MKVHKAIFPEYSLFRAVCSHGLSEVRPLRKEAAAHDEWGWNFGSGWPPSYWAYGRMRALAETGLFDLVVACEIVEHVAHTIEFHSIEKFAASGRHILISTPNGSHFRNRLPTHSAIADFLGSRRSAVQAKKPNGYLILITADEMINLAYPWASSGSHVGTPLLAGCAGRDSVSNLMMPLPRPAQTEWHTANGSLRPYLAGQ
jgi:hypothetical protein